MEVVNYLSNLAIPLMIVIIVIYSVVEGQKIFDDFLDGAKEGLAMVISLFPTLIGLFVAVGALRSSGLIDVIVENISIILNTLNIPSEIMPLALLRPISGSSSMAIATDIMKTYGVDSQIRTNSFNNYGIN